MRKDNLDLLYNIFDIIDSAIKRYPVNLAAKWLSVILFRINRKKDALKLVSEYTPLMEKENIFDIIFPAINKMLENGYSQEKIFSYDVIEAFNNMAEKYLGFKRFYDSRNINAHKNMEIREIATLLPYYYS